MDKIKFSLKSKAELVVFNTIEECASSLVSLVNRGDKVAVSGGSTFAKIFSVWRESAEVLSATEFFPVDERVVPFDSEFSNWGNAYSLFLKEIGRECDRENFAESTEQYIELLSRKFGQKVPLFDLIMLGVGDDGHTASLFPGGDYFDSTESVLSTVSPKPPFERISLSANTIARAKSVVTVVYGSAKKSIFNRIVQGDAELPIVRVLSKIKKSFIYVDGNLC